MFAIQRIARRLRRLTTHTPLAFVIYRYRYLTWFVLFGALSVLTEVALVGLMPRSWPLAVKAGLGFCAGLSLSFVLNATFNFRVQRQYLLDTFLRFARVSTLSFVLNMSLLSVIGRYQADWTYGSLRYVCAAALCMLAYALHRRLTFQPATNFGVAVYASRQERVRKIFRKVGRACDHIHIDLVDTTMNPTAAPVDTSQIALARKLWPGIPFAIHVMSRTPQKWVEQVADQIDWFLFHLDSRDDLFELIAWCRQRGKKVGVVWHQDDSFGKLLQYLPHLDFVMVLGIAVPGRSGQAISEKAVETAAALTQLRSKYDFRVMFDGSVNLETVSRIEAEYLVAASAVLNAPAPVQAIYHLKTGGRDGRVAA